MDEAIELVADRPGVRLDRFISDKRPEISRTHAQKLIETGLITVNGKAARASLKLSEGDRIKVIVPPTPPTTLEAQPMALNIVYEDADVLVIDKPAGLTVHPAPGHPDRTLVNAILAHFPGLAEISDSARPGIVHRLDKDTSGLMLVAKTRAAQANLIEQFKAKTVVKVYQVLVKGRLAPERGIIEAMIGRDSANRQRMAVVGRGREARTEYRVLRHIGEYTLAEVRLHTGRTHQIRVHFATIGYPVVGDAVYGVKSSYLDRQFLHACRLGFKLPSSGKYVEFTSPLPADLQNALKRMEGELDNRRPSA